MPVVFRHEDVVSPSDDIVLRAGGGRVENLVTRAIENAPEYAGLVAEGICSSPYTISVHIPRVGRATKPEILSSPGYAAYKPYLEVAAADILGLGFVEIVATTIVIDPVVPTNVDLCHYDVVVIASDEQQLAERMGAIRGRFVRDDNPYRR